VIGRTFHEASGGMLSRRRIAVKQGQPNRNEGPSIPFVLRSRLCLSSKLKPR
jgi:hypothetical protein